MKYFVLIKNYCLVFVIACLVYTILHAMSLGIHKHLEKAMVI